MRTLKVGGVNPLEDVQWILDRERRLRRHSVSRTAEQLDLDTAYLYRVLCGQRSLSVEKMSDWAALYGFSLEISAKLVAADGSTVA